MNKPLFCPSRQECICTKTPAGKIIYVGKAKSLRARVRSYFNEDRLLEAKTGSLISEARDVDYILVDNEKEALALENNLIKQYKPRYNVLLRDDKTYPYIKLTNERFPRVYVTRRLKKDGSTYFGPYFPGNLAYRLVHFIHRHFLVPCCKVDLTRFHPKPCLQFHIHRCLGPCVEGLTTDEAYSRAVRQVRLFLEGRHSALAAELREQTGSGSAEMRFEEAAAMRDVMTTVEEIDERQKMAAASGNDADIFGLLCGAAAGGGESFPHAQRADCGSARILLGRPARIRAGGVLLVAAAADLSGSAIRPGGDSCAGGFRRPRGDGGIAFGEDATARWRSIRRSAGRRKPCCTLAETNAKHSFDARFRVLKPSSAAIQEALQDALSLPEAPKRIECFDISHVQGTDKVASMVVWEDGRMKKADYRKFIIRTVEGNDDFASMREVVTRRYSRLQEEGKPMPGLVLIDGGLGQLHAAAEALEAIGMTDQPLASIAKREEIVYVLGQEDEPVVLDRFSPILHLIQTIRDEAHRFAVTFHRTRRNARTLTSELDEIPGIGPITVRKLLKEFGSSTMVRQATEEELARKIGRAAARKVRAHYSPAAPLVTLR